MDVRVDRVQGDLILSSIANESLVVRERDIGWGGAVALVIGNDLYTIVLPDTNAAGWERSE